MAKSNWQNVFDPGGIFPHDDVGDEDEFGRKPRPVAVPTPEDILREASLANIANVGNINKLASAQNEFNLDEALKEFERVAPGVFPKLIENITASARGEVSEGVRNQIARSVASRGVDRGTSGSIFDENDFLRHLGVTSMSEQQRGQNNFQALMKGALPNLFDTSQSFLKPTYDPYAKFQNDLYNEKIAAAPNPVDAGNLAATQAQYAAILGLFSGAPATYGGSGGAGDTPYPTGIGASEGGGNMGSSYNNPWSGRYGETAGFGAFDF